MSLPELCIRRPVFTTMLILLPVVLGVVGYTRIGVDAFPNVDLPIVIVTTSRPGASVEEMEIGVTKVVEEAVNTIAGIDELRSTTREGMSVVTVAFVLEKNRDVAQQEVQSKINTIVSRLPTGTETPIIDKFDLDASPVMSIAVSGSRSMREITEIADKQIRESLSSLGGVGAVTLAGGQRRAINVVIDPRKLEAYGLSVEQVRQALVAQNLELPGGRVDQSSRELVLRTMGRVEDARQFNDIIVTNINGQPIRIRDLGPGAKTATDSEEEPRSMARLDGKTACTMVVQKQSGANTVQVIDTVKKRLAELEEAFREEGKADIHTEVIADQSRFINASLHEVTKHLWLGGMLVALTILMFLRDWRTMIMASIAIPVSLISTLLVMWLMGYTLNGITMVALVLAIGIVIDDAIVVHENIFRWMEEKGYRAWDAALAATKEIALAVLATTCSLVVIFLPIAFMSGRVGRFYSCFGITCAVAITVSLVVSFTLTPMLCSRFLRLSDKAKKQGAGHHSSGVYGWIAERPYLLCLRWAMRHRWVIVMATVVITLSAFPLPVGSLLSRGDAQRQKQLAWLNYPGLFKAVGFDFMPKDDRSEFEVAITMPPGWTLQRTSDFLAKQIEPRIAAMKDEGIVLNTLTTVGDVSGKNAKGQGEVTNANIYIRLVDIKERKKPFTQGEIMGRVRRLFASYPDLRVSVQVIGNIGGGGGRSSDVEFALTGPDINRLLDYADQIVAKLRANPGLVDVDTTLANRKPELRLKVDRERAADLGVSIQTLSSTLRVLVGGQIVSDYKDTSIGEQYDVWLRADRNYRNDRATIENLSIPSTKAGLVKVSSIASPSEDRGPSQIDRMQRQRKVSIVANLAGGLPMNEAQAVFLQAGEEVGMPADYRLIATGRAKTQNESNAAFLMAFMFSFVFMYMVLAAQFESFIHPITILMGIPLTIPFALISLWSLGEPLTVYSILGLFLLFGIVKKNGILQVDYTNVLRGRLKAHPAIVPDLYREGDAGARGWGWQAWMKRMPEHKRLRLWAIMEANRTRLRPILMTTLMLVAAMIPIAMGQGAGAANRAAMAKVIVGGQALSLLLSLLVTPVAYSLFDDISMWWRRRSARRHPEVQHDDARASAVEAGAA